MSAVAAPIQPAAERAAHPAPASVPAIELRHLSFRYDSTPILDNVTLCIGPRDFVSIVGPNGGGKTTLLKIVLGLLRPESGDVRIFGQPPREARARIGYMPQYAQLDPQFPVTVLDVVLMGRLKRLRFGPYSRADRAAAVDALEQVNLAELRRRRFSALSGGQRQRVLIARALACRPELLLLDEPTANLDLLAEDDFYDLLTRLNERLAVVLVSHDIGIVSKYVQRVICVNRTVTEHPTSELTGEMISQMYGGGVSMVRHDHCDHHGPPDTCHHTHPQ